MSLVEYNLEKNVHINWSTKINTVVVIPSQCHNISTYPLNRLGNVIT